MWIFVCWWEVCGLLCIIVFLSCLMRELIEYDYGFFWWIKLIICWLCKESNFYLYWWCFFFVVLVLWKDFNWMMLNFENMCESILVIIWCEWWVLSECLMWEYNERWSKWWWGKFVVVCLKVCFVWVIMSCFWLWWWC